MLAPKKLVSCVLCLTINAIHSSLNSMTTHSLRLVSFFAALLVTCTAHAELKFEQTVIEDVISPNTKSYPFEFAFKNEGESVVEISEIKTTCGCTTAKLEKMTYTPGESGVIEGSFSVGSRQGEQDKKVRVFTKGLAQSEILLTLKVNIPQLITMESGVLLWRVGELSEAKKIIVRPDPNFGVSVESVDFVSSDFAIEVLPSGEDEKVSGEVVIAVRPLSTKSVVTGVIEVSYLSNLSNDVSISTAYVLVR